MSVSIDYVNENWTKSSVSVDRYPDTCPVCGRGIEPSVIGAFGSQISDAYEGLLQVAFRCPIEDCQKVFVGYYTHSGRSWGEDMFLSDTRLPHHFEKEKFDKEIENVSPNFVEIFNQAKAAEDGGLNQICGPGYRKALEFLVRDYLIHLNAEGKEEVKKKNLTQLLNEDIESEKIRQMAKRAWWIGSDETHYYRKWEDMDIQDLKNLIRLTTHLIAGEIIARNYLAKMPNKTGPKGLKSKK